MKLISVIIPCYNVSEYLERCMRSLEEQTIGIEKLEIILLDDASSDGTWECISGWEKRYPEQVMAIRLEKNGGQGKARNIGLSYASCEWVSFLDADDWTEKEYFEKLYYDAVRNDCDMACCLEKEDTSDGLTYFSSVLSGTEDRIYEAASVTAVRMMLFFREISRGTHSKIVRKSVLSENGIFFPEGLMYEDLPWGTLLVLSVKKAYLRNEYLYHYFRNPHSTVMTLNAPHHLDLLTIHIMMWRELAERRFYETYKDEIEYDFLYSCGLGFLKMLYMRFSEPNYSYFRLMQEIVKERIPDHRGNLYIRNGDIKELHLMLIDMIYADVDKGSFTALMETVRRSGL